MGDAAMLLLGLAWNGNAATATLLELLLLGADELVEASR